VEKGAYYKGNTAVSIDSPKEAAKVIGKTDAAVSPANKF
jgi:hypothetical protein